MTDSVAQWLNAAGRVPLLSAGTGGVLEKLSGLPKVDLSHLQW